MTPQKEYETSTGDKATYRVDGIVYHTLRYVRWLENKLTCLCSQIEHLQSNITELKKDLERYNPKREQGDCDCGYSDMLPNDRES